MRLARMYAFGVAFSFAALALLVPAASVAGFNEAIADALRSASWVVAGLSALSATRDHEQLDETDGISTLTTLRGATRAQHAWARTMAASLRIGLGVCVPGLVVLLVAMLRAEGSELTAWSTRWAMFIVLYSLGLGATLSLLARASRRLAAQQAWLILLGVVLVPELLRALAGASVPSLPAACRSLIGLAEAWGRVAA